MIQRIIDYVVSICGCGAAGGCVGMLAKDPVDGVAIGAVTGAFVGAAVRAWRSREIRESYEERGLGD